MSDPELPGWVGAAVLGRVWELIAARLEREGLVPRGGVMVRDLSRDERHAMTDLLGRSVVKDVTRVDLSALDDRLWSRAGMGLPAAASGALGRDLADLPAQRARRADERASPFVAAREWLDEHGVASDRPGLRWVGDWLDGLRRDGMLVRVPEPSQVIVMALEVLAARDAFADLMDESPGTADAGVASAPPAPAAPTARTELAAAVTGSAHGLDDSERLSGVVLRALSARLGVALPRSADDRRRLWESARVVTDRVSSTCLVWGVAGEGHSGAGRLDVGDAPTHITWWDLTAGLEFARGQRVLVCENPRTLEAMAELGVAGIGVVCAMGRPALVVLEVLTRLRAADAELRYHGDFDWAGVAMANALVDSHGARPWLMSAGDYLAGHGSIALGGVEVEPTWDAELGAAMRSRGVAVHEEAVLTAVVAGAAAWGAAARRDATR